MKQHGSRGRSHLKTQKAKPLVDSHRTDAAIKDFIRSRTKVEVTGPTVREVAKFMGSDYSRSAEYRLKKLGAIRAVHGFVLPESEQ